MRTPGDRLKLNGRVVAGPCDELRSVGAAFNAARAKKAAAFRRALLRAVEEKSYLDTMTRMRARVSEIRRSEDVI